MKHSCRFKLHTQYQQFQIKNSDSAKYQWKMLSRKQMAKHEIRIYKIRSFDTTGYRKCISVNVFH